LYADNVDWQQYEDYDPDLIVNVIPPHYYYTYPFWYGYPYWYEYPRWRVYPYWYDWGLFPVIRMHTIISIPRFHVVNWYFNRPHHHIRYHRLSAKFIDHYQGHRSHGSSIVSGVKQWQQSNRSIITEEFLSDQKYRSIRLQQFGRMEADRSNYNRKHPDNPLTSATYVQRKRQKYTALVPKSGFSKTLSPRTPVSENKKVTRTSEPKRVSKPEPSKTKEQIRTIDKAKDYHRNHWTKKPPAKAVEPKSSPRTKTVKPVSPKRTPAKKTPVTKKTTPRKKSAGQSQ
ncbi:MAG: hypothetical protein HKN76_00205, partial [Saprospiraceae bacterium]|nr:hypothetical protein [Saprospiraceae bacterium]